MKIVNSKFIVLIVSFVLNAGLTFCSLNEPTDTVQSVRSLKLIDSYLLEIREPSGLALSMDGKSLWTVSDNSNLIYQISLTGQILKTLSYQGQDLEGIAVDAKNNTLWVAEERTRELVNIDSTGQELQRYRILDGNDNSGLEGICIDANHHLFTIKEKKPGLFISLKPDFTIEKKLELNFANDYAGLCADSLTNRFWILSAQDQTLFYWDFSSHKVLSQFKLSLRTPEGIAIDFKHGRFYIVSDSEERLYVFTK